MSLQTGPASATDAGENALWPAFAKANTSGTRTSLLPRLGVNIQTAVADHRRPRCPMASFHPNLGRERALFSQLGLGTTALSGNALTSGLLLFRHIGDGRDHRFEQRLQLRLLTEALNQFDPRSH